jgi:hypothetical protein
MLRCTVTLATVVCLVAPAAARPAEIAIDTRSGALRINGVRLRSVGAAIGSAIGRPSRTITAPSRIRHERFGRNGSAPVSTMVTVVNTHVVFDGLGLVFSTSNSSPYVREKTPSVLYVVYRRDGAAQLDRPAVMPHHGFAGVLRINGHRVSTAARALIPSHIGYRTDRLSLLGTTFGTTSRGGQIDSIYAHGRRAIRIFLDDAGQSIAYLKVE